MSVEEVRNEGAEATEVPLLVATTPFTAPPRRRAPIGVLLAATWLAIVVGAAVLADVLPLEQFDTRVTNLDPKTSPGLRWPEVLGTDSFGRSVVSRAIFGARQSLIIAGASVLLSIGFGVLLGTIAGYLGGRTARVITLLTDATLSIPGLVTVLAIAAVGRRDVPTVTVAFAVVSLPVVTRLARAHALALAKRPSIEAATALGATRFRIVMSEMLPDVLTRVSPLAFVLAGHVIVGSASLAFLGLGIPPPSPSWGAMINEGRRFLESDPHLVFVPAGLIFLSVVSFTVIGDHIRRRVEGSSR